ncbi:insulin-like growth factor binding proteinn-terminal [Anaeramoeba ignava]|uniref:Insulin-like growth factor binding proteinn-terminal n=1 Tax=Anaeramoeba ignava TaxID=1746090 RepID=A0A9Q0LL00_ANAIG|nr:insulin-like growth factor binding proteinn-terminal [Anaeramoeba ignava]
MNEIIFFGQNSNPKLFKNESNIITKPIQFKFENENENKKQIKQIASGYSGTIFLFKNGKAIEYSNNSNQNPSKIQIENIQKVTVGFQNEVILTIEGNVFAKGIYINPKNPNQFINISSLIEDKNDRIIQDIVSGWNSIYLLTSNQNAYGIGSNDYGQVGFDSKTTQTQKPILMMKNVSKIFSGNSSNHVFLLNSNQELFGCGNNEYGQLGLGESRKEETKIPKLTKIQNIPKGKINDIQCGYAHSIMLIENQDEKRKFYSCGRYYFNGLGKNEDTYEFTEIKSSLFENDDNILDFSVGCFQNLILTSKRKIIGFGGNFSGELGTGDTIKQPIPIQIEFPKLRFNENISNYHFCSAYYNSFLYYSSLSFSNLEEDLIKLYQRKEFCDISFKTENGEIIEAHKLILKYRLNQNQNQNQNQNENQIEKLQEIISKKSIKESNQIFEMIYSNKIINPILYSEIKEIINSNEKIEEIMKRIYLNEKEKDFIIERKEKQYKFPKLILIMRSELYRGMFLSVTEDKSNKVTDYSELSNKSFQILEYWIYSNQIKEDIQITQEIIDEIQIFLGFFQTAYSEDHTFCPQNFDWDLINSNSVNYFRTCCAGIYNYNFTSANLNEIQNATFYATDPEAGDFECSITPILHLDFESGFNITNSQKIIFNATGFSFRINDMKTTVNKSEVYFYGSISFIHPVSSIKGGLENPCPAFDIFNSSYVYFEDVDFVQIGNCNASLEPLILMEDSQIQIDSIIHDSDEFLSMTNPTVTGLTSKINFSEGNPTTMNIRIVNPRELASEDQNVVEIQSQEDIDGVYLMGDAIRFSGSSLIWIASVSISKGTIEFDQNIMIGFANVVGRVRLYGNGNAQFTNLYCGYASELISNISVEIYTLDGTEAASILFQKYAEIHNILDTVFLDITIENADVSIAQVESSDLIEKLELQGSSSFECSDILYIPTVEVIGFGPTFKNGFYSISNISIRSELCLSNVSMPISNLVEGSFDFLRLDNLSAVGFQLRNNITIENVISENGIILSDNWIFINNIFSETLIYLTGYFELTSLVNASIIQFEDSMVTIQSGCQITASTNNLTFWASSSIFDLQMDEVEIWNFESENSSFSGNGTNSIHILDSMISDYDEFHEIELTLEISNLSSLENSWLSFYKSNLIFHQPVTISNYLELYNTSVTGALITLPRYQHIWFEDCINSVQIDSLNISGSLDLINSSLSFSIQASSQFEILEISDASFELTNPQDLYEVEMLYLLNGSISNLNIIPEEFYLREYSNLKNSTIVLSSAYDLYLESSLTQIFGDQLSSISILSGEIIGDFSFQLNSINFSFYGSEFELFSGYDLILSNNSYLYLGDDSTYISLDYLSVTDSILQTEAGIDVEDLEIFNSEFWVDELRIFSSFQFQEYQIKNIEIYFDNYVEMIFDFPTTISNSTIRNYGQMEFSSEIVLENISLVNGGLLKMFSNFSIYGTFSLSNYDTIHFGSSPPIDTNEKKGKKEEGVRGDILLFAADGYIYNQNYMYLDVNLKLNGSLIQEYAATIEFKEGSGIETNHLHFHNGVMQGSNLETIKVNNGFLWENGQISSIKLEYPSGVITNGVFNIYDSQIICNDTTLIDSIVYMGDSQITTFSTFQITSSSSIQKQYGINSIINYGYFISLCGDIEVDMINHGYLHIETENVYLKALQNYGSIYLKGYVSITDEAINYGDMEFHTPPPTSNNSGSLTTNLEIHPFSNGLKSIESSSFQNFGNLQIVEHTTFTGNFSTSSNSTITVEISNEYQTPLSLNGGYIYLSGLIDVSFVIAQFQPELEQAFTIIYFGSVTGKDYSTLEYYDSTEKFEVNFETNQIQYVFMGCQTGSYSADLYSECQPCGYGRYSSSRGSFFCNYCPLGYYTNQTGSSDCSPCSQGTFSSKTGAINCQLCVPGTFTANNGSQWCSECPDGYYTDYEGATECTKCGTGHQTKNPSSCDPCPSGTYNNKEASLCVLCSSGTYSGVGAISCTACGKDYYQDQLGQPSCKNCPANTITFSQGSTLISECVCREGMYGEPGGNCKECPEGGICDVAGITEPQVKAGYWADDNLNFYHCDPFEACPGGAKGTCNSNLGYEGVMCSECSKGFYRISGRCEKCPANAKTRLIIAFFLIMIFAIILLIIVRSQARSYFGSLSIAFSFFQILATLPKMNINWPPRLQDFMNSLTSFNFNVDLVAPECSISASFTGKWFAVMLIPFVVFAMFAFLFLIVRLHAIIVKKCGSKFANKFPRFCSRPTRKTTNKYLLPFSWIRFQISKLFTHGNSSAKKLYSTFINGYVAFAFLVYLVLCQWVFDLFSCTKQADGIYTLNAAPSYRCYNDPWWKNGSWRCSFWIAFYVIGIQLLLSLCFFITVKNIMMKCFIQDSVCYAQDLEENVFLGN